MQKTKNDCCEVCYTVETENDDGGRAFRIGSYCTFPECSCHKKKNPAAVALGKIRTEKKAKASRLNGKLGGRKKKTPHKISK